MNLTCNPVMTALGTMVIAVSVLSGTAWAQQGSVKFSGRVIDQVGGVLQNATLLMSGPSNTRGVTTSDDRGRFEFNLPPGQWILDVYASGFGRHNDKITLELRKDLSQEIRLIVGTATLATSGAPLRATEQSLESDLVSRPRLTYPDKARSDRVSGTVRVEAVIETDGSVFPLHIVNRDVHPSLGRAAVEYVAQYRYKPRMANGQPRQILTVFTVNFMVAR